jgi:hypothetical protein
VLALVPHDIPGYSIIDSTTFREPNAGRSFRYSDGSGFEPDVYIYPMPPGDEPCVAGCLAEAAEREYGNFKGLFPALIQRKYYDSIVVIREEPAAVPAGSWLGKGRHATLRMVVQGQSHESHFIVYAGRDQFVKVRVSAPVDAGVGPRLDAFLGELVARAPAPFSCARGETDAQGIMVSVALRHPPEQVAHVIDSVLGTPPRGIDYQLADQGYWRSLAIFSWPGGSGSEDWHDRANPGYRLTLATRAEGDSTKLQVASRTLCRPEGKDVAQMLTLLSAMSTMTDVMKGLGDTLKGHTR